MKWLGLQGERPGHSLFNPNIGKEVIETFKKERINIASDKSFPRLPKRQRREHDDSFDSEDNATVERILRNNFLITDETLQIFVSTWKEACCRENLNEVGLFLDNLDRCIHSSCNAEDIKVPRFITSLILHF